MRTKRLTMLLLIVLWAVSSQPVMMAATYTGTVASGDAVAYRYNPGNGQALFTLLWQTTGTELFLLLGCELDGEFFPWGTAWGKVDRTARLEVGTLASSPRCVLVVQSVRGSSAFTLNAQKTSSLGLARALTGASNDSEASLTPARLADYPQLVASLNRQLRAVRAMDDRASPR